MGDKFLGGVESVKAAVAEAMALRCEVSSNSPALSAVSLAVGKIFRAGRKVIVWTVETVGEKKGQFYGFYGPHSTYESADCWHNKAWVSSCEGKKVILKIWR